MRDGRRGWKMFNVSKFPVGKSRMSWVALARNLAGLPSMSSVDRGAVTQ